MTELAITADQPERIAAIDIGSNSLHMVIGDLRPDEDVDVIDREKDMVKLGSGVQRTGRISARAWHDGLATMERFAALTDSMNVTTTLGVATSACREADNGGAFLDEVEKRTGVRVRLISGAEEGRLIHAAVKRAIQLGAGNNLIIDIGGGSIELITSRGTELVEVRSVNLGVQRLLDTVGHAGPLKKKERKKLRRLVDDEVGDFLARYQAATQDADTSVVVGTSGTIEALGEAAHQLAGHKPWRHVNAETVATSALKACAEKLGAMDVAERHDLGIAERRADSIQLGAVVLVRILELAGADQLTLCDASLRDGVVAAEIERRMHDRNAPPRTQSVRQRAVLQLAGRYGVTVYVAQRVARIATMLFDGLKPTHQLRERDRKLLVAACLLFDVGRYIHRKRRHKHGRYLIQHSRLRGFTQDEIDMLALMVRYHRRALPKKKHKRFKRQSKRQRRVVSVVAGILRLAIALDRRHVGRVERVSIALGGDEAVVLCEGRDVAMEVYAAKRETALLERSLGISIVVREHGTI